MTMDFLLTTVLILTEVIIVLGALAIFLFLRMRHIRNQQTPGKRVKQADTAAPVVNLKDNIRTYLQTQSDLTKEKIESVDGNINPQQQLALASRLSLLSLETEILNTTLDTNSSENDWQIIYQKYASDEVMQKGEESYEEKLAALNMRIKKLEVFKDLFTNAQNRLKKSFNVINELKTSISELPGKEENIQIEEMVDQLSVENINLHKQLDEAHLQLKNIFEEATLSLKDSSETGAITETVGESTDLQSENEFLAKQIQELLAQDREKTLAMQERIAELESQTLQESEHNPTIDDLKEENEFLTRQIQFLLKQELETQETINSLEGNIAEATEILEKLQSEHTELEQENIELQEQQHSPDDMPAIIDDNKPDLTDSGASIKQTNQSVDITEPEEPEEIPEQATPEEPEEIPEQATPEEPEEITDIDERQATAETSASDHPDKPSDSGNSETTKKQP